MTPLALILVPVIVTGSLASEAPEEILTVEKLMEYSQMLPMMLIPITGKLEKSKTAPVLWELASNAHQHWENFKEELPSNVIEASRLVRGIYEGIMEKGDRALMDLRRKADIVQPLVSVLSHYGDQLLEKMQPSLRSLYTFMNHLDYVSFQVWPELLKPLDELVFYSFKQLEDTQPTLQASADEVRTRIRQGLEAFNKNLEPYFKTILEESQKHNAEFREWVETSIFPPDP